MLYENGWNFERPAGGPYSLDDEPKCPAELGDGKSF